MLLRSVLIFFVSVLVAAPLAAQWQLINPLPTNNHLSDMVFLNTEKGVAVGSNGTILTTVNGGETWRSVTSGSFTSLNSVASPDSSSVFICGNNGLLFKSDFSFTRIDTLFHDQHGNLQKIWFLNNKIGFCIGDNQLVLKTVDGGKSWTALSAGHRGNLTHLSFANDSTGYLIGKFYVPFSAYSADLLVTKDQGNTWQLVDSLTFDVRDICFTDPSTGYLGSYDLLKTTDGGKTWSADTLPEYYFTDIFFRDPMNGWAISYDGSLVKTTDGGTTWQVSARNGTSDHLYPLGQEGLITYGLGGDIWVSRNPSQTWRQTGSGDRNMLMRIQFVDSRRGFIVGNNVLYRTTNAGKDWQVENHPAGNIDDVSFADKDRCLILSWGGPWLTTDGCISWHKVEVALPRSVFGCSFADEKIAYITGVDYGHFFYDPVTLKSSDGGETWKRDSLPGNPLIRRFRFTRPGLGFALDFNEGLYRTSDAGDSWKQVAEIPSATAFRDLFFPDSHTGYAIGVYTTPEGRPYNVICKSQDGGDHWFQVFQEDTSFRPEYSGVYFTDESTGYVAGSEGFLLKTADGGNTWKKEYQTNSLYGLGGTGDRVWAVGGYGTILTNTGDSGFGEPDTVEQNLIKAMYPNPFQSQVTVQLLLDREGPVRITLTDLTGRRIDDITEVFPLGETSWTYNGAHLQPGVYILTVRSESAFTCTRLLKLKVE